MVKHITVYDNHIIWILSNNGTKGVISSDPLATCKDDHARFTTVPVLKTFIWSILWRLCSVLGLKVFNLYMLVCLFVCLSVCLSVCLFVSNKRRAQIYCGTSRDPREGLWMIKISKICFKQNSIFINLENLQNFLYVYK